MKNPTDINILNRVWREAVFQSYIWNCGVVVHLYPPLKVSDTKWIFCYGVGDLVAWFTMFETSILQYTDEKELLKLLTFKVNKALAQSRHSPEPTTTSRSVEIDNFISAFVRLNESYPQQVYIYEWKNKKTN